MLRSSFAALAVVAAIASASTAKASDNDVRGPVNHITDGDTLIVDGVKIRLHGIDAPELRDSEAGLAARAHLTRLVAYSTLRCVLTGERSYDRYVAKCRLPTGEDVAGRMVRDGWAVDWPRFSKGRYAGEQAQAYRAGIGMYAFGIHPWR